MYIKFNFLMRRILKNKIFSYFSASIITLGLIFSCPLTGFATTLPEAQNLLKQQKAVFESDKLILEGYKNDLQRSKQNLRDTVGQILRVTESLRKINTEISGIDAKIGREERLLFSKNKQLAKRAIEIYKIKDQQMLWVVLSLLKGDLSKSVELITFLVEIEKQDANLVHQLDIATKSLRQEKALLKNKKSEKLQLFSRLNTEERKFSQMMAERASLYEKARRNFKESAVKYETAKSEYNSRLIKQKTVLSSQMTVNNSNPQLSNSIRDYMAEFDPSPEQRAIASRIRGFIESQFPSSPLLGKELVFVEAGEFYSVDPRLLVAISKKESGCGTAYSDQYNNEHHNAWGYGPGIAFGSWEEAIFVITAHIADKWGANPQPEDLEGYCIPSHPWIEDVRSYLNSI